MIQQCRHTQGMCSNQTHLSEVQLLGSTCRQYSATERNKWGLQRSRWRWLLRATWRKRSKQWSNLRAHSTKLKSESWVICCINQSFCPSYHQKYILQKHGSLLTSIGLSRGPKLVASSLAARLNGYLGGYGTKVKGKSLMFRITFTSGELSGRNGDIEPVEPRRHWLCCRWDRASYLSSLLELKTFYLICALLHVCFLWWILGNFSPVDWCIFN